MKIKDCSRNDDDDRHHHQAPLIGQHRYVSMQDSIGDVIYDFIFASPAVPHIFCSSYLNSEMGGKWPQSYCFVGFCFQNLFKTARTFFLAPMYIFLGSIFSVPVVHPNISKDKATASKKSCFILSVRSDLDMIDNR